MRLHHTLPSLAFVVILATAGTAVAQENDIDTFKDGGASVFEVGAVQALPRIERSVADFLQPSDPDATPVEWDGPRLDGIDAVTMSLGGGGFTDLESMDQLTGPDGQYLARIGFEIRNPGDVSYYLTQPQATLYIARFTGEPQAPDGGVLGVSLAFTWPGEEVLTESLFPSDPLLGFAHSVEYGTVAGEAFDGFNTVQNGTWTRFSNPLLTAQGPIVRDQNWYFAWTVPGVPERAAVTLSYATDPSDPNSLISQQLEFTTPTNLELPGLELQYADLTPTQQADLENQWIVVADADAAASPKEPTTTVSVEEDDAATTTTEPPTTVPVEDDVDPDEQGGEPVEVPVDPPLEADTADDATILWLFLGLLAVFAAALGANFLRKWRVGPTSLLPPEEPEQPDGPIPEDMTPILDASSDEVSVQAEPDDGDEDGRVLVDWGGPPGSEFDATELSADQPEPAADDDYDWATLRANEAERRRAFTRVLLDAHHRAGGQVFDGEWIAPTDRMVSDRHVFGDELNTSDLWAEVFINIHTLEWVRAPDPLFEELFDRYKRRDATDFDDGVVPS